MAKTISLRKYGALFELPFLDRDWLNYNLGGGYGNVYKERRQCGSLSNNGRVLNATLDQNSSRLLHRSLTNFKKHKWNKCSSLYLGILIFCGPLFKHKINYVPMEQNKLQVKIRKCLGSLEFPDWAKAKLEEIWDSKPDFLEYLEWLYENMPKLNFDLETAKTVYLLQGDLAIFGILGQIYTVYHQNQKVNIKLIPDVPVEAVPRVSDFVSGVFFPVVVTKFSNKFHWEDNDNGTFLIDEHGSVIDCVRSGDYTCANDPLFNRLGFVYRDARIGCPWRICWNWGEIVDAVGYFGGDVLVRGLSESFIHNDWHRFGVNGLLMVRCGRGRICGSGYSHQGKNTKYTKARTTNFDGSGVVAVNLLKEKVDVEGEGRVLYSNYELLDWFELGELCLEAIEENQ